MTETSEGWVEWVFYAEPATKVISQQDRQPCQHRPQAEKNRVPEVRADRGHTNRKKAMTSDIQVGTCVSDADDQQDLQGIVGKDIVTERRQTYQNFRHGNYPSSMPRHLQV